MAHAEFVHLHLHTEFSLLDGACRLDKLVEKAHDLKFPALSITDHGVLYGAIDFYKAALEKGIKPIIGCEVYVAPGSRLEKKASAGGGSRDIYNHLVLLAKDEIGYKNLVKLATAAHIEGYYYKPRIDKEILAANKEGLIALSGCLASEVPELITKDQLPKAREAIDWFKQTLGAENFYLELQNHGIAEQAKVNRQLIPWAKEFGLKLVCTNDVHYINKSDSHAHDCLICIGTQTHLSDTKRMKYQPEQFFLRSADEMKALFSETPDAVKNTLEVAEKCNLEIKFGQLHYPVFHPPEHFTREGLLRKLLADGLHRRYTIHARAEGQEFVIEGIDDPTRLPRFDASAVARASRPCDEEMKLTGETPVPLTPFNPFDKSRPVSIQTRSLPHWQQDGAIYFVTYRLADSLPKEAFRQWLAEKNAAVAKESQLNLPEPEKDERISTINEEYREKLERHLDEGQGDCWLRNEDVSAIIEKSLKHFDGERYLLGSYVIMPNHVHVLVRPATEHKIADILQGWKSFTAKEANKFLGRSGEFWQAESFDHIVRDENHLEKIGRYIEENPTKAKLSEGDYRLGGGLAAARASRPCDERKKLTGETPVPLHEQPAVAEAIQVVIDRLQKELVVIEKTGFIDYFLIVADFVQYGRSKGVSCVARGSAAGSIVTYLLEIANVDPIRYGLLFERFLNPERVNPPDIDIDFADDRRAEIIEYVREKYGRDSVAQIITFGTMGAKSVVRDVGRVMGLSYSEGDRLAKMIPAELKMDLAKALKQNPEFKAAYDSEEQTRELVDTAFVLEDITRNSSVHAAGVVIGDQPLVNLVPLKQDEDGVIVTQYAMNPVGDLGLLKMDFLGLKTLTVIRNTCELVKQTKGIEVPIDNLPLEDAKTYDLLNKANTIGIFQLESSGMRDLCKKFKISSIEHITALVALYRPGPMDLIPDFIKRRHGEIKIEYPHPLLEPISKETYGVLIYQEQVMQATQVLAGYTLGSADLLRRAMGKKKVEEMQKQRETFVKGAAATNKIPAPKANEIFDLLEKFAGYGFNKSHAAAYAIVAYQTAYLKANYPVEFLSANMTNDMSNTDKLSVLIEEARNFGVEVLAPDVNESQVAFAPAREGTVIRFGLAAIKGVGEGAVQCILSGRESGKFNSLEELCERVDGRALTRKVLEALIKSGACDCFGETRSTMFARIDRATARAASIISDRQKGQNTLFGMFEEKATEAAEPEKQLPEWPQHELLANEKELLGFYVTGHPLTPYAPLLEKFALHKTSELAELPNRSVTRIGGLIGAVQQGVSKKSGKPYAMVTLEDLQGSVQVLCMNENYEKFRELLIPNKAILVVGEVNTGEDKPKIFPQEIMPLEDAPRKYTKQVHLRLNTAHFGLDQLDQVREMTLGFPGKCPLFLCLRRPAGDIIFVEAHERFAVTPSWALQKAVDEMFGEETYYAKVDTSLPERTPRKWEKKSYESNGDE